jgi:hypothetical protein
LLAVIPVCLALPFWFNGRTSSRAVGEASDQGTAEHALGRPLLRPTFLPREMVAGSSGVRMGTWRALCDFSNDTDTLVIAQEKRSPDRDAYNHNRFNGRKVPINGQEGTLTTGTLGERRLTFYTPELTVILSSATLTDRELVLVAQSMK